jgi:hypothetical protein
MDCHRPLGGRSARGILHTAIDLWLARAISATSKLGLRGANLMDLRLVNNMSAGSSYGCEEIGFPDRRGPNCVAVAASDDRKHKDSGTVADDYG